MQERVKERVCKSMLSVIQSNTDVSMFGARRNIRYKFDVSIFMLTETETYEPILVSASVVSQILAILMSAFSCAQMNATSSRAHTVVTLQFDQIITDGSGAKTTKQSEVNLVDLAGSERAGSTGAHAWIKYCLLQSCFTKVVRVRNTCVFDREGLRIQR